MNTKEIIRGRLDGVIPEDLLRAIESTVQKYENQKLTSAGGEKKMEWKVVGTAEVITWLAASDRDELRQMVQGVIEDPNSVEWWVDDCDGVDLLFAMDEDGEVEELDAVRPQRI
jgi:hypothetical protein